MVTFLVIALCCVLDGVTSILNTFSKRLGEYKKYGSTRISVGAELRFHINLTL